MGWVFFLIASAWCALLEYRRKRPPTEPPMLILIEILLEFLVTAIATVCLYQLYIL
jgi:hypothetical protein